jgi:hypothetical protein
MGFRYWIESEARALASRDMVLNFLQDQLKIKDTEAILDMSTDQIDSGVIALLSKRGIISANDELQSVIKNGIKISELIKTLSKQ